MVWKLVSATVLAVISGLGVANAQSANDFSGPRELPPASFKGQQFVDSRGCVFLKAGLSGRVTWVPRVSANRKQLCGYPPTFAKQKIEVVEDAPKAAPAPAPVMTGRKPVETVATITTPPTIRSAPPKVAARVPESAYAPPAVRMAPQAAAPKAVAVAPAAPARKKVTVRAARPAKGQPANGCYADVPVLENFALRGGGRISLCTRGDGDLRDARAPRLSGGAAAVNPSGYAGKVAGRVVVSTQDMVIPKGYKKAWADDRLNPNRGKGTAEGWADQDQVWTRELPARSVAEAAKAGKRVVVVRRVAISSKSSPVAPVATAPQLAAKSTGKAAGKAGSYIQIGLFGVPANANGAAARLKSLGLPVAMAKARKSGQALQVVMAGPFASANEAQRALAAARRAGFKDAYIR